MSYEDILYEVEEPNAIITLNRPDRLNSFRGRTIGELLDAFRRKVNLLQNTILLINEIRKGEGANALDLIDEIRETEDPTNPI